MKRHTAAVKGPAPWLALGLLVATALLPPLGDVADSRGRNISYLTEGPLLREEDREEYIGLVVNFTGTVVEIDQRMGGTTWTVEVDTVLVGPPLSGPVAVRWIASSECHGRSEPGIGIGDLVEVHGMYDADGAEVTLCPSADYYIRKAIRLHLPTVLNTWTWPRYQPAGRSIPRSGPAESFGPHRPPAPGG